MSLTYREAGVDIEAGDQFVDRIGPLAHSTFRPEVVGSLGGFSGLFALNARHFRDPILVSGTDGVGTKLKLAFLTGKHSTVGIDLVAMSVNDVVTTGAEPLFFLDYFATSKLDIEQGHQVIAGIAEGCRQAHCALLGGETAEMPGFYAPGEYDLAGFAVGVVERDELLGSHRVQAGDRILGLASTGLHSNGFSLVRRVLLEDQHLDLTVVPPGFSQSLGEALIQPTRIYVRAALELKQKVELHALAHITGSGLPGNIPRVIPENLAAQVQLGSWPMAPIFDYIRKIGKIDDREMLQTFNCGVGMAAVLPASTVEAAQGVLEHHGISSWVIGSVIERRSPGEDFFFLPPNM